MYKRNRPFELVKITNKYVFLPPLSEADAHQQHPASGGLKGGSEGVMQCQLTSSK